MERIKTAVITGGSGGIGAACAELFAKNGYCAAVLYNKGEVSAVRTVEKIASFGDRSFALKCDVTKLSECEQALSEVNARGCSLDVLVNCAGAALIKPIADTTPDEFDWIYAVNMRGVFNMSKAAIPHFLKTHSGAIVNVSSMWGICGASCEAAYSAAKAAVIGFTKASAKELAPSGITVNCVAPGVIDTPMNADIPREELDLLAKKNLLGRIGAPEEVAQAVLFLAQSRFITGKTLSVDGGFSD